MEGISIRQKLILGCVVPLLALLALLVGATQAMSQLMAGMNAMYQGEVVQLKELKQIADLYAVKVIDAANKANVGGIAPSNAKADMQQAQREIAQIWQQYRSREMSAAEQQEAASVQALFGAADQQIAAVVAVLDQMQGEARDLLAARIMPLYGVIDPVSDGVSALVEFQLKEAEQNIGELNDLRQQLFQLFILMFVVGGPAFYSSVCGPGVASVNLWSLWAGSCAACRPIST
ncbi:MCP four helix bundle domain-containing protein [Aeromonas salmonicida]|nr:MCP four helix bundle domain-containing protein [Aeromonas salmonicida]MDF8330101.1 MCP four helix bundle domain-containing protein [Aeromonas salmonicida]